jgi:hypothetical protein
MPVSGPVAKISLFSGENGWVPGFRVSQRILLANPLPPKKFRAKSWWYGSGLASLLVKLTFRKTPVHPCTLFTKTNQLSSRIKNKNVLRRVLTEENYLPPFFQALCLLSIYSVMSSIKIQINHTSEYNLRV